MKKDIKLDKSKLYGFKLVEDAKAAIEPKIGDSKVALLSSSAIEPKIGTTKVKLSLHK